MKRFLVIITLLATGLIYLAGGCSKEIKGPERVNVPPKVSFVNIPVERARFSSDTTIYWYGTDVDGYIKTFRYTVVESSIVGDPDAFLSDDKTGFTVPEESINWVTLDVDLQNTSTNDRVRMSADVSDPVRTYVTSYVFLQAIDNLDAKSEIVFRAFLKNNHFPETDINVRRLGDPYINSPSPEGILEGVTLNWSASDPIDYRPGREPPFEYRWTLYGPFTDEQMETINEEYIDSVFQDRYGDLYLPGETLYVYSRLDSSYIDTNIDNTVVPPETTFVGDPITDSVFLEFLVDNLRGGNVHGAWNFALLGINHEFDSLVVDPSDHSRIDNLNIFDGMAVDSSGGWTYAQNVNVYDIFRNQNVTSASDTTREMRFLIWCQTRDDANVPDLIPAFKFISVIEPKFERDVVVLDALQYNYRNHFNFPVMPPRRPWSNLDPAVYPKADTFMVRDVYGRFLNNWKAGTFEMDNLLPDTIAGEFQYRALFGATEDYYPFVELSLTSPSSSTAPGISLREVLKHKVIIVVKDCPESSVSLDTEEGMSVIEGLNSGMSCMIMARAPGGPGAYESGSVPQLPDIFPVYFGINSLRTQSWQERRGLHPDWRIEDFTGALPLMAGLPELSVDTFLLEHRYVWSFSAFRYYPFREVLSVDPVANDTTFGKMLAGGENGGYGAYPEVGYIVKSANAEPLYLHNTIWNKYGLSRPYYVEKFQGTVCAIRYQTPWYKTATFGFTVLPLDPVTAQVMFNEMMDWLSEQTYIQTGKPNTSILTGANKSQQRQITKRMRELKEEGLLKPSGASVDLY